MRLSFLFLLLSILFGIVTGCGFLAVNDALVFTNKLDDSYQVYTNHEVHIDKRAHSLVDYFQTLEKVKKRYPEIYNKYKDRLEPNTEFGKLAKHYKTKVPGVFAIPTWGQYIGLIPSSYYGRTYGYYLACRVVNTTTRKLKAVQIYVAAFNHFNKPLGVAEINSGFTYGPIGQYNADTFIHNSTISTAKWFSDINPQNVGRIVFFVNQAVFQ